MTLGILGILIQCISIPCILIPISLLYFSPVLKTEHTEREHARGSAFSKINPWSEPVAETLQQDSPYHKKLSHKIFSTTYKISIILRGFLMIIILEGLLVNY